MIFKKNDAVLFIPAGRIVYVDEDQGEGIIWIKDFIDGPSYYAKWDEIRILTPLDKLL